MVDESDVKNGIFAKIEGIENFQRTNNSKIDKSLHWRCWRNFQCIHKCTVVDVKKILY